MVLRGLVGVWSWEHDKVGWLVGGGGGAGVHLQSICFNTRGGGFSAATVPTFRLLTAAGTSGAVAVPLVPSCVWSSLAAQPSNVTKE